jgi:hypothetical protein
VIQAVCLTILVLSVPAHAQRISDEQIAREVIRKGNRAIIEEFLKQELREVNEYAAKPLLRTHPSLTFFINQADRGPLNSLLFLEKQVYKLQDAQRNIGSLPYVIVFSSSEKKKILGLRPAAKKIISYGIPLMKRDFYRVLQASKMLAQKKGRHPLELLRDPAFRDAVYRECARTPQELDREMGELSEGEMICIRLGWVLEQVRVTRLWLLVNDNSLPEPRDYAAFRTKRSEYFRKRLKRIFGS